MSNGTDEESEKEFLQRLQFEGQCCTTTDEFLYTIWLRERKETERETAKDKAKVILKMKSQDKFNFPCSKIKCKMPDCTSSIKSGETKPANQIFRIKRKVGAGGFGQVYAVEYHQLKATAMKIIPIPFSTDRDKVTSIIQVWQEYFNHMDFYKHANKYVVKPIGYVFLTLDSRWYLCIFSNLMKSDAKSFKYLGMMTNNSLKTILSTIVEFLKRTDSKWLPVQHGDLKPHNILINYTGGGDNIRSVKLCDFGLSRFDKRGGSPVFSPKEAFQNFTRDDYTTGRLKYYDSFSFARMALFLAVQNMDDFFRLCFFPIEDEDSREKIIADLRNFLFVNDIIMLLDPTVNLQADAKLELMTNISKTAVIIPSDNISLTTLRQSFEENSEQPNNFNQSLMSFAAFNYSNTKNLTASYMGLNSLVSNRAHDQDRSYLCWAYSCASMLRSSWCLFLDTLPIDQRTIMTEKQRVMENDVYDEIVRLMMMLIVPKTTKNRPDQSAYLSATVSRVRRICSACYQIILARQSNNH